MTKIKNSKKGLAKKAMSISLAAAMLATSNVPVFAADFSDGSAAGFTAEAPVAETETAEVPETTSDVPAGQAVNDSWTVTFPDGAIAANVGWKDAGSVTVQVAADGSTETLGSTLAYVWKDAETGYATDKKAIPTWVETESNSNKFKAAIPYPTGDDKAGHSYILCIYDPSVEGAGQFAFNSTPVAVGAVDVKEYFTLVVQNGNQMYNGREIDKTVTVKTKDDKQEDVTSKFNVDYTGSLINAGDISVTATANASNLYSGSLAGKITVTKNTLSSDYLTASLTNKTVAYTGEAITALDKSAAAIAGAVIGNNTVDITGVEVKTAVPKAGSTLTNAGDHCAVTVGANVAEKGATNFTAAASDVTVNTEDEVTVAARDLSTVTATIEPLPIKSVGYTASELAAKIEYKDADGKELTLQNDVDVTFTGDIKTSGNYTLTISPKTGNKNVTGTTTATLSVYSLSISEADFAEGWDTLKAEEYTGTAIEKDAAKLPAITYQGKTLELNKDYSISYKNNINASADETKTAEIVITGLRSFEGSQDTRKFKINQATITSKDDIKADTVVINEKAASAADYAKAMNVVVKGYNGATPEKEFTLKEGTDYTVAYEYDDGKGTKSTNTVDQYVRATITLENKNFKISGDSFVDAQISNPIIKDADIKMTKTSYEYTGSVITPEFTVTVDGKTLTKDTDYRIKSITQSAAVGKATLTIEGIKEYAGTATATFEVIAASADKLIISAKEYKPVYTGKAIQPKLKTGTVAEDKVVAITLAGNDVTDQFTISSYGDNINAGKAAGFLVVTPVKDNKNFVTGISKTFTFDIDQAELTGTITMYNANKIKVDSLPNQVYDGNAKTFDDYTFVFTPIKNQDYPDRKVTEDDYEFAYYNNVLGDSAKKAQLAVIAKGNYKVAATTNDITDESAPTAVTVKNVVAKVEFALDPNPKQYFTEKDVTVENAAYPGENVIAQPTIVVRDNGKVLTEGTDYIVTVQKPAAGTAPSDKQYTWEVTGKGAYRNTVKPTETNPGKNYAIGTAEKKNGWIITKKDVAALSIKVSLDSDGNPVAVIMNGNLKLDSKAFDITLGEDKNTVTVAAKKGDKYYFGSQDIEVEADEEMEVPVIVSATADRQHVIATLKGASEGAVGYDYVVSTSSNPNDKDSRVKVNKNKTLTRTTFYNLAKGDYYVYCHPYKMVDGKKTFNKDGGWSNSFAFTITADMPDEPEIKTIKTVASSGNNRKVTMQIKTGANTEGVYVYIGAVGKNTPDGDQTVEKTDVKKVTVGSNKTKTVIMTIPAGAKVYASAQAYNYTAGTDAKVWSTWAHRRTVKAIN